MKNIPVFTACGGTATLILREVPCWGRAYVILQTCAPGRAAEQAADCVRFCRQAGAREVYLTRRDGEPLPYAFHYEIRTMRMPRDNLWGAPGEPWLQPVEGPLRAVYLEAYNRRFAGVLGAAHMDEASLIQAETRGVQHFLAADRDDRCVGLGAVRSPAEGEPSVATLEAVASLQSGWGLDTTLALLHETTGDTLTLQVSSANAAALRLYLRMGFNPDRRLSRWYIAD